MRRVGVCVGWSLVYVAGWLPSTLHAQTPTLPSDRLGWTQEATSLEEAQSLRYTLYVNGGQGQVLTATCAGAASPFTCAASFPPLTPGTYTVEVTSAFVLADGRVAESARSAPFVIRVYVAPAAPTSLQIVP